MPERKFYLGLDLGQRRDYSAIAVVEREEQVRPYGEAEYRGMQLVHMERLALGTTYAGVVERVRDISSVPELAPHCELIVDATGVGAPVVEMLRAAKLGWGISAVTITGGGKENRKEVWRGGDYNVPKADLVAAVQLALENNELRIARGLRDAAALVEELVNVRKSFQGSGHERVGADRSGEHDDLVIALALACWKARKTIPTIGMRGTRLF